MNPVDYTQQGTVAVLTLQNPPVNGLGHALRSGIRSISPGVNIPLLRYRRSRV